MQFMLYSPKQKYQGNYDWTAEIEANKTWIDVSPLTGKANEEVTVQVTVQPVQSTLAKFKVGFEPVTR